MHQQNHSMNNMNPMVQSGTFGVNGNPLGGNSVTMRGNEIPEYLATGRPSKNIIQAHLKVLRFYRRVCRLLPFILRVHDLNNVVGPEQAMVNVANMIRKKAYLRDPGMVDQWVQKGYEHLMQAEWHYCNRDHLFYILTNSRSGDSGYSYLEEVKMQGKSGFLKDFYTGNKTNEY